MVIASMSANPPPSGPPSGLPSVPASVDVPRRGTLCGIDHGRKRIGVAVTDTNQTLAMPLATLISRSPQHDAAQFQKLRSEYGIVGWVLGLPLHMSGEESSQSQLVRKFGDWLAGVTGLPVIYWDERLTSSAAEVLLWSMGESPSRDKARVDGLAAQQILETYLRDRDAGG